MDTENTSIYWLTLDEINELNNFVIAALNKSENKNILHRIQSELSVAKTRNENSPLPSNYITSIMELPENSIPIRLSSDELEVTLKLNLPKELKGRLL